MIWIEPVGRKPRSYSIVMSNHEISKRDWDIIEAYLKTNEGYIYEVRDTFFNDGYPAWIKVKCTSDKWHELWDNLSDVIVYRIRYNQARIYDV